jgi:hypothetical protein
MVCSKRRRGCRLGGTFWIDFQLTLYVGIPPTSRSAAAKAVYTRQQASSDAEQRSGIAPVAAQSKFAADLEEMRQNFGVCFSGAAAKFIQLIVVNWRSRRVRRVVRIIGFISFAPDGRDGRFRKLIMGSLAANDRVEEIPLLAKPRPNEVGFDPVSRLVRPTFPEGFIFANRFPAHLLIIGEEIRIPKSESREAVRFADVPECCGDFADRLSLVVTSRINLLGYEHAK